MNARCYTPKYFNLSWWVFFLLLMPVFSCLTKHSSDNNVEQDPEVENNSPVDPTDPTDPTIAHCIETVKGEPIESLLEALKKQDFYNENLEKALKKISPESLVKAYEDYCKEKQKSPLTAENAPDFLQFALFYQPKKYLSDAMHHVLNDYNPAAVDPYSSFAVQNHRIDEVYIAETFNSPLYWREKCLSFDPKSDSVVTGTNCYKSKETRLNLHFLPDSSSDFRVVNEKGKCLECIDGKNVYSWQWALCDQSNSNQVFKDSDYKKSSVRKASYRSFDFLAASGCKSEEVPFHFRDAFPEIAITPPIREIPSREEFIEYVKKEESLTSDSTPDIYIIWLDTLRTDFVDSMPTLKRFREESTSFKQYFSGASNTRPSAFATFYSRSGSEWQKFLKQKYGSEGSINLNILRRMGYQVHGFGFELVVADEHTIQDGGWDALGRFNDEIPQDFFPQLAFFHRNMFDFKVPLEERKKRYQEQIEQEKLIDGISYSELVKQPVLIGADLPTTTVFEKVMDQIHTSNESQRNAHFIRFAAAHVPYTPLADLAEKGLLYYPGFFPKTSSFGAHYPLLLIWHTWDLVQNGSIPLPIAKVPYFINSYMNAALGSDLLLDKVLKIIKKNGKYDNSIIVVMADHGEGLGEQRYFTHGGSTVSGKLVDAPVFIKFPNSSPQVLPTVGSPLDIFPSIFDYLKVNLEPQYQQYTDGKSIFSKDHSRCWIAVQPNYYHYQTVDFAFYNGKEKLRLRFCQKETTPNKDGSTIDNPRTSPLYSTCVEPVSYTDKYDTPLDPGKLSDFPNKMKADFKECFNTYLRQSF